MLLQMRIPSEICSSIFELPEENRSQSGSKQLNVGTLIRKKGCCKRVYRVNGTARMLSSRFVLELTPLKPQTLIFFLVATAGQSCGPFLKGRN